MSTEFFNDQWRIPSNENQNKISNYSMSFDGTNQGINLGSNFPYPSVSTDPWSISFWIKPNSATSNGMIFSTYDVSGIRGFYVVLRSGGSNNDPLHISSLMRAGTTGYSSVATSDPIALGEWQHIVVAYNGAFNATLRGITIYVNGSPVSIYRIGSVMTNGSLITTVDKYIGQREDNSNYLINCDLDQVTIFDYELSQDQVASLGQAPLSVFDFNNSETINFGYISSLSNATKATFSFWVKKESSALNQIFGVQSSSSDRVGFVIPLSNTAAFYINGVGSTINNFILNNGWHHIVIVWDASESVALDRVKIYLNNSVTSFGNASNPSSFNSINADFKIGQFSSQYLTGQLSNFQIFSTALPATGSNSVETLYNNGRPLPDMSSFTSLQGWWKLDDTATFNSSTSVWTIPDDSYNSNTGTSNGMNASNLVVSDINGELITNPMITSPKPIAYYQLGDQSVDNGANLLVPNNSLSDYVFNFSTNNESINLGNSFNYPSVVADPWTVSFWVKPTNATSGGVIFSGYSVANNRGFFINMRNWPDPTPGDRRLQCLIRSNSNIYTAVVTPSLALNEWTHVAVCYGGGGSGNFPYSFTIYFNNSPVSLVVSGGNAGTPAGSVGPNDNKYIGQRDGAIYLKNTELSELSFFKYKLSSTQVDTVYNNGKPGDISSLNPLTSYELNASEVFNSTSTEWSVDNNVYPSVYQSSLNFDGSSDYVDCGNNSSLSFDRTDSFSFSAWINSSSSLFNGSIFSKFDNATTTGYFMGMNSARNNLRFAFRKGTGGGSSQYIYVETSDVINTNQWSHVVATYNGNEDASGIVLYVNGVAVNTTIISNSLQSGSVSNNEPFIIGSNGGATFFNGRISNLAVFNSVLTGSQVATIYNNGTPEASISHSPVSWWKLDNTTTGLIDNGSASNNGTNNGATEYAGFVNTLAGESSNMDSSNLVVSDLQQTNGYSPYALDFDGVDDYLTITSTDFKGSAGTVSYSFWVKPETYGNPPGTSNYGYFTSNSSTGGGISYSEGGTGFGLTPGQMYLYNITNAGAVATTTSTIIDENVWNHIVVVFNTGNIVQFYKNGFLSSTITGVTSFNATWDTIAARRYSGGFNNPINGDLSNFSIFDTALTSTEVAEIYNQGVPSNLNTFSGTAPVSWWQLGSNSSYNSGAWTCLDEIGTNNAVSAGGMTNDDIVDGVGYSASGLGTSSIDIKGDAPYSTANGLSENMDVLDRTTDVPS